LIVADKEFFHLKVLGEGGGYSELAADSRRHKQLQMTTDFSSSKLVEQKQPALRTIFQATSK
jgi:hypothetical protein